MTDFCSLLQLDKEVLAALANAYSSYATYLDAGQSDDLPTIAGSYMKAAGYEMLFDHATAGKWFRRAADYFVRAADTYGIIAAICSNQSPDMEIGPSPAPDLQFYLLLSSYFKNIPADIAAWEEPVGRLQIPMRLYLEAFEATEECTTAADLSAAWKPLLTRMHTRPRLLSKDTKRWRSLEGTINPIEPETIATCVTLLTVAYRQGITRESIEEMLRQQKDAVFIAVKVALQLLHPTPPPHSGYNHS